MTVGLRPYPEYKDSGVPWLGKVPEHWVCAPHRALFSEINEQGHAEESLLSVTISKGVIRQSDLLADTLKKDSSNLDKSKYKLVLPNDLAYNKMRAWQGAVGVSRFRGIVSPAYIVVRPRANCNPNYFHFLFRTPEFAKEAERWSYGITSDQWSLRPEHFKMIRSCVPSRTEQDSIVGYLSAVDLIFRRFIRNRRQLIALLNEQKQAIINQAVTRGLDPNVRLKPSGVDWLGDIPEHWSVGRVKSLCSMKSGEGITNLEIDESGPFPVYGGNGLRGYASSFTHSGEFVLVGRQGAKCGNVHHVSGEFWASEHAVVVTSNTQACIRWIESLLSAMDLNRYSIAAAQPGLAVERILNLGVPVPPLDEQQAIAGAIASRCRGLHGSIVNAERQIALIREYRTRLISDVVTGKVDVRSLAEGLEDEPIAPEDLSDDIDSGDMPEEDELALVQEAADADE